MATNKVENVNAAKSIEGFVEEPQTSALNSPTSSMTEKKVVKKKKKEKAQPKPRELTYTQTLREKLGLPEMPIVPTVAYLKENLEVEEIKVNAPLSVELQGKTTVLKGKNKTFILGGMTRTRLLENFHHRLHMSWKELYSSTHPEQQINEYLKTVETIVFYGAKGLPIIPKKFVKPEELKKPTKAALKLKKLRQT